MMLSSKISTFISLLLASLFLVTTPSPASSQAWLPWLFQGLQVIQLSAMSDRQEVQIGQQIHQQLINSRKIRLSSNRQLQQKINVIGQRLAARSSRSQIPYTFSVVDNPEVNAFATMGGYVYVNTGLIAKAENEAELAGVMAHEIAHVTARHAVNQMRNVAISQGLMSAAGIDTNTMVRLGVELAFNLPYSREAEREADQLGLKNMIKAGYAPIGMISFMQKLASQSPSSATLLSTHPAASQRVIALKQSVNPTIAYQGDGLNSQAYQQQIRSLVN